MRGLAVNETSFASDETLLKLSKQLSQLEEAGNKTQLGNLPAPLAGDFTQLEPAGAEPLCLPTGNGARLESVTTPLKLGANRRLSRDEERGKMLASMRSRGASPVDPRKIDGRVVWAESNVTGDDIPSDAACATPANADQAAINDGALARRLEWTHDSDGSASPPRRAA